MIVGERYVHVLKCFSPVKLLANPWAVAHQAPLSMEFSRQKYWSGLPFSPPGDLSNPRIEPVPLVLHWQADSLSLCQLIEEFNWEQRITT